MLVNWALRPVLRKSCEEFDRSLSLEGVILTFGQPRFRLFKLQSVLSIWDKNLFGLLFLLFKSFFPHNFFVELIKVTVQEQGYKAAFFKNKVVLQQHEYPVTNTSLIC